ncbi:MAG: M28 family peptidase [Calditrichaeota bacterium]|nr:M28 family peptidase [Calditrichota bacterium]
MPKYWFVALSLLLSLNLFAQRPAFNADSAYANLKYLSETIGPRAMGTRGEAEALKWFATRLARYGADTTYVMPFYRTPREDNISSGNALGIFPGQSDTMVVIGGHIDSDDPENPGASDNASGTACVLELARIWGKTPHRYTLVFVAFGGEEAGLVGSSFFADNFAEMERVALMFSIDMAGSEEPLIPFIDVSTHQSPIWLVADAYGVDAALGFNSLDYPTHFFSINAPAEGAGSDHMPFLKKGIPAIDFTTGVNGDPIHTHQDRIAFVSKPMLARSGLLVDSLLAHYDRSGIPAETTGNYLLWDELGMPFFIPGGLLKWLVIIMLAIGIVILMQAFKMRDPEKEGGNRHFSGLKLVMMALLVALAMQFGEMAMQAVRGLRYPWLAPLELYVNLSRLGALLGLWASLMLTGTFALRKDYFPFARNAIVTLVIYTILFSLVSFRLGLYPAVTLLLISVALGANNPWMRLICALGSVLPFNALVFHEMTPLIWRSLFQAGFNFDTPGKEALISLILTLLLALFWWPLLNGLVAIIRREPLSSPLITRLRSPLVGVVLGVVFAGYWGVLSQTPAVNDKWQPTVRVIANYRLPEQKAWIRVAGNEYLHDVSLRSEGFSRDYEGSVLSDSIAVDFRPDWLHITGSETPIEGDSIVAVNWRIISQRPWYQVALTLKPAGGAITSVASDWGYRFNGEAFRSVWTGNPRDTLEVVARFGVKPGTHLIREVTAAYLTLPVPVEVRAPMAGVSQRTSIVITDTLDVKGASQ